MKYICWGFEPFVQVVKWLYRTGESSDVVLCLCCVESRALNSNKWTMA